MADNYVIVNQRPDVKPSDTGIGFMDVWHVTYRVTDGKAKGTTGVITVPEDDHNADYVNKTITDKIATLNAVANL